MAKIVNLTDVSMGVTYIHPLDNGVIRIQRNYTIVGDDPALLSAAGTFVLDRSMNWVDVPQNIKDALIAIDNWTTAEALAERGI